MCEDFPGKQEAAGLGLEAAAVCPVPSRRPGTPVWTGLAKGMNPTDDGTRNSVAKGSASDAETLGCHGKQEKGPRGSSTGFCTLSCLDRNPFWRNSWSDRLEL